MAAADTFEWYVSSIAGRLTPEIRRVIEAERQTLMTLRSEDERQRHVDEVILTLRTLLTAGHQSAAR